MKSCYKAGLIGAAIAMSFTFLSRILYFLPFGISSLYDSLTNVLFIIVYLVPGFLAAFWLSTPKTIRQSGVEGVKAGLIVGILDGVFSILLDYILSYFNHQFSALDLAFDAYAEVYDGLIWIGLAVILGGISGLAYGVININQDKRNMIETNATTKKQFLIEWMLLNSAGWIIGFLFIWFIRASNLEAIHHDTFSVWQAMLLECKAWGLGVVS